MKYDAGVLICAAPAYLKMFKLQAPSSIVVWRMLLVEANLKIIVSGYQRDLLIGPVLGTLWLLGVTMITPTLRWRGTYRSILSEVRSHDYDAGLLFPHHPPEISYSPREWPLGSYVGLWIVVMTLEGRGGVHEMS